MAWYTLGEIRASLIRTPVVLPQARQAHGGAEFPGFGTLLVGDSYGAVEAGFGCSVAVRRLLEQEFTFQTIQLGLP